MSFVRTFFLSWTYAPHGARGSLRLAVGGRHRITMAAFYVRRRKASQQARSGGVWNFLHMEHPELSVSKQHVETICSVIGQVPARIWSPKRTISLPHLFKNKTLNALNWTV
jgi:hypothetical protein